MAEHTDLIPAFMNKQEADYMNIGSDFSKKLIGNVLSKVLSNKLDTPMKVTFTGPITLRDDPMQAGKIAHLEVDVSMLDLNLKDLILKAL